MKYIKELVQGQRNEIEAIFKAIDTDNNGYLSRDEFVQAFSELKLNTKYLGLVYKKMDKNNDQKVSYVEFLSSMLESNS
jgi:Ca2+-binding EF-hand superfamily protein